MGRVVPTGPIMVVIVAVAVELACGLVRVGVLVLVVDEDVIPPRKPPIAAACATAAKASGATKTWSMMKKMSDGGPMKGSINSKRQWAFYTLRVASDHHAVRPTDCGESVSQSCLTEREAGKYRKRLQNYN